MYCCVCVLHVILPFCNIAVPISSIATDYSIKSGLNELTSASPYTDVLVFVTSAGAAHKDQAMRTQDDQKKNFVSFEQNWV